MLVPFIFDVKHFPGRERGEHVLCFAGFRYGCGLIMLLPTSPAIDHPGRVVNIVWAIRIRS